MESGTERDTPLRNDVMSIVDLEEAKQKLSVLPIVVGIACCPQVAHMLKRVRAGADLLMSGVPLLIDTRMTCDKSEAYFNQEDWRLRCKEQAIFDGTERTHNRQPVA